MTNKLNEKDLNKVSGGQGEYSSAIDNINNIKQDLKSSCGSIQTNPDYNLAISYLNSCTNDLAFSNTEGAKKQLTDAAAVLASLSRNYPDLEKVLMSYMNQILNVLTTLTAHHY